MRVLPDRGKCQGYGNCAVTEPRVFDLDEDGFVKLLVDDIPEELWDEIKEAARGCPMRALVIDE